MEGSPQLTDAYSNSVTDGQLGLGTDDAISRFDDLRIPSIIDDTEGSLGELPSLEKFDDGTADHLQPKSGSWLLVDGRYQVSPAISGDGISQLLVEEIPDDVKIGVTVNADDLFADRFSNGFVIFDYHGPNEFKYAGGCFFRDQWTIGQRTSEGWVDDVVVSASLDAFADYNIRLVIEDGSEVSLYNADSLLVSHNFGDSPGPIRMPTIAPPSDWSACFARISTSTQTACGRKSWRPGPPVEPFRSACSERAGQTASLQSRR